MSIADYLSQCCDNDKLTVGNGITSVSISGSDLMAFSTQNGATLMRPTGAMNTITALHLRAAPGLAQSILAMLPANATVQVYARTASVDGYSWSWIQSSAGAGWVASEYLAAAPSISPVGKKAGVHVLQDSISAVETLIASLRQHGKRLASATVVNDPAAAIALSGICDYVIYRYVNSTTDSVTLPNDQAGAIITGINEVRARYANYAALAGVPNIYIQVVNEVGSLASDPMQAYFWIGVMQGLEVHDMKAAIAAYSVGTPEPAQWQAMSPALTWAKQHGHIAVLHAYTEPNAAAGQLSGPNLQQYWEGRFARLYDSVSLDAHPPLVLSEFGTYNAAFPGTANLLSLVNDFEALVEQYPYVAGYCIWTIGSFGGWQRSDITQALPALAQWLVG